MIGKVILFFDDGEIVIETESSSPLLEFLLINDPLMMKISAGIRFESPKFGRYSFGGSLKAGVNKMQKGRDFTFILKDISLN